MIYKLLLIVAIVVVAVAVVYAYLAFYDDNATPPLITLNSLLKFNKHCYVTVDMQYPLKLTYSFKFDIKLHDDDGLAFMIGGPATVAHPRLPFVSVWLAGGKAFVACNGSTGLQKVVSNVPLNDRNWHTVAVSRTSNALYLSIDAKYRSSTAVGSSHEHDTIQSTVVYVGGRPVENERVKIIGVAACLKNLTINEKDVTNVKAIGPVETTRC